MHSDPPLESELRPGQRWVLNRLFAFVSRLTRYSVFFPSGTMPYWPDLCLLCGEPEASRHCTERLVRAGMWSSLVGFEPFQKAPLLEIPVCETCFRTARRQKILERLLPLVVLIVLLLSGLTLASWLQSFSTTLGSIGVGFAVIGSVTISIALSFVIGTPFEIVVTKDSFQFTFRSEYIAQALASENGLEVTVSPEEVS